MLIGADAVLKQGIPLETAIKVITSIPAAVLKLKKKGSVAVSSDADLVLLNKEYLTIDSVIARGKVMIDQGEIKVKGTFE